MKPYERTREDARTLPDPLQRIGHERLRGEEEEEDRHADEKGGAGLPHAAGRDDRDVQRGEDEVVDERADALEAVCVC
jgi:hypothetical protein